MIMILILVVFHNECKFQQFQRVTTKVFFSNFKGLCCEPSDKAPTQTLTATLSHTNNERRKEPLVSPDSHL